jgi:hypothetical protein
MPSNWAELRNACDLSGAYTLTGGFDSTAYDDLIYIGWPAPAGPNLTKINQTVAIIGNGAVVDASKKGSFFRVMPGASLTLQSITLQNGQNVSRGCQSLSSPATDHEGGCFNSLAFATALELSIILEPSSSRTPSF